MNKRVLFFCCSIVFIFLLLLQTGCANIIPPGGGPRDTLAPVLVKAVPADSTTRFNANKISLYFDEYVVVDNLQENLIVSPNPKNIPTVESKLHTVSIRLRDTLEPNTTYSLNFGRGIKDVNEGNSQPGGFVYVFSTGPTLDENTLSGKVLLAETGKVDTTLIVVLQRNLDDSAVAKDRPRYYTKLDGKGNFKFQFLPKETYNVFALPNDYAKRYDDSTKLFAFLDSAVHITDSTHAPLRLYAYQESKEKEKKPIVSAPSKAQKKEAAKEDKRLKLTSNLTDSKQDLLGNLELNFNFKLEHFDSSKILLTDTNYHAVRPPQMILDSSLQKIILTYPWVEDTHFKLVVQKDAVVDSAGTMLIKNDTISFATKRESEYGSIRIRFANLDLSKNPVFQLVKDDKIVDSIPLTSTEWYRKLYQPGDYEMRMLYDRNKNGKWDPGHYFGYKLQPEIVYLFKRKLNIRANWENEYEEKIEED